MSNYKISRNAYAIKKKGETQSDLTYWLSKSYQERLQALESLRQQFFSYSHESPPRLQRVYRVVDNDFYLQVIDLEVSKKTSKLPVEIKT